METNQNIQERQAIIDCYRKRFPKATPDVYDSFADMLLQRLDELRKPSDDIVKSIKAILSEKSADIPTPYGKSGKALFDSYFEAAAKEIAKLQPLKLLNFLNRRINECHELANSSRESVYGDKQRRMAQGFKEVVEFISEPQQNIVK